MPTPLRAIRVEDELWDQVKAGAKRRNLTVVGLVKEALTQYLGLPPVPKRKPSRSLDTAAALAQLTGKDAPIKPGDRVKATRVHREIAQVVRQSEAKVTRTQTAALLMGTCPKHPKAIVKDGVCQTCHLEAARATLATTR